MKHAPLPLSCCILKCDPVHLEKPRYVYQTLANIQRLDKLVCTLHRYAEFKKLNAEVIGVSVDSPHAHLAWSVSSFPEK